MPDLLSFGLLSLAVWRVSRMVATERGPFDLFLLWRNLIARTFKPGKYRASWVDEGFNCPKCMSFWVGLGSAWAIKPAGAVEYIVTGLALAAVAVMINSVINFYEAMAR